jgi:hypothetical protein
MAFQIQSGLDNILETSRESQENGLADLKGFLEPVSPTGGNEICGLGFEFSGWLC